MNITEAGIRKTAFLIELLGSGLVQDITNNMDRSVIAQIKSFNAEKQNLTTHEATKILNEFVTVSKILVDSDGSIADILNEWDENQIVKSPAYMQRKKFIGFVKLDEKTVEQIYEVIKNESTMYKVVILRQLSDQNAQEVFNMLEHSEKVRFALESQNSAETPLHVLEEISNHLHDTLEEKLTVKQTNYDKMITLACGLGEQDLNEFLAELPSDIAEDVRANVITFTDIMNQTNDILQQILAGFDAGTLAWASCAESEEVRAKLLTCVAATKRADVEDAITDSDTSDTKSQEAAKRQIVSAAKSMSENGSIEFVK